MGENAPSGYLKTIQNPLPRFLSRGMVDLAHYTLPLQPSKNLRTTVALTGHTGVRVVARDDRGMVHS